MEQATMFNMVNFDVSAIWNTGAASPVDGMQINRTIRSIKLNSYICPSDTNLPGENDPQVPGTSYGENRGLNRYNTNWRSTGPTYFQGHDGGLAPTRSFASIQDGLSNTALFSEIVKGKAGMNLDGLHMTYNLPGGITAVPPGTPDPDRLLANLCQSSTSRSWDFKGELWTQQDSGRGGGYYHIQPPNRKSCNAAGFDTVITAGSYHPGGVNVLLADGSVRFIKSTITVRNWHALGTQANGDLTQGDL